MLMFLYILQKENETKGMILLINNRESIFLLDIVGSIDLSMVPKLLSLVNDSEDLLNFKLD